MSLNESNQKVAETREQHKKETKEQVEGAGSGRRKRIRVRLIPVWFRLLIVALLIGVSVILGAVFGYGVIGKGKASDVFEKSTWTHIKDLIEKE